MSSIVQELIEKWIEITGYDENQKTFNLLSANYNFHRCGERMKKIMKFDSSGAIACLYAKASFETICKRLSVNLADIMKDPHYCDDYVKMWQMFCCSEMEEAEKNIIQNIVKLTQINPAIGSIDEQKEKDIFMDSIEYVAEELTKCHLDSFYMNPSAKINDKISFNRTIKIFNTTTECVLTVENNPDGLYLCYIKEFDSPGGYFTYLLKSGENIFSVNDKVYEHFTGQHTHSRNNRYIEDKCWHIFPYKSMVKLEGSDYKGYAKSLVCVETERDITTLPSSSIYCIMLSAALIINKFSGKIIKDLIEQDHIKQLYINTMLKYNQNQEQVNALVPVNTSSLVLRTNRDLPIEVTSEEVASNKLQSKYDHKSYEVDYINWHPTWGCFTDYNEEFVEWYGQGFELDNNRIMQRRWPLLTAGQNHSSNDVEEFIGTYEAVQTEFYRQARLQLKDYIIQQMVEEYNSFGGYDAIVKWYYDRIKKRIPELEKICLDYYIRSQRGEPVMTKFSPYCAVTSSDQVCQISTGEKEFHVSGHFGSSKVLNSVKTSKHHGHYPETFYDLHSDATANVWFAIVPGNWKNIEKIVGEPVPNVLRGYTYYKDENTGNHLLYATDPIAQICHPLSGEAHRGIGSTPFTRMFKGCKSETFAFIIGYSKRTLNKLVKEYEKSEEQ